MKDALIEILQYEYDATGGHVTIKFDSGYTTRRKFHNKISDGEKICSLSNNKIPEGLPYISIGIKRKGYPTLHVSQLSVNEALLRKSGEIEEEPVDLEKALLQYNKQLSRERRKLEEKESGLRKALRDIKFKQSGLGQRCAATSRLLELITKEKK